MARIPETEIERLKTEVSVQRLVESTGIELKKSGKDLLGHCPFHDDSTASLVISPSKNLWHCFGCGLGGGSIDWVMKRRGISFRHAAELLREGLPASTAAPAPAGRVKRSTVRALAVPVEFTADDQALLDQTAAYYHQRLKQTPEALAYLAARGIAVEAIDHFRLGVADRSLGLRLPDKSRKDGRDIRARLQSIGLYRESGHEHLNGSLIVPIFDEAGHVLELYGRKIRDDLRPGTPKHLYLPAREGRGRGVFNLETLAASPEIILCEALIDALTFWSAGYKNVTSAYGIEGFTEEHLAAFKRYGTQRVLIAFDRDEPGERGAQKVAERLMAAGIDCFRIQFPKGMDANDYALKVQPAVKSLGLLIRKAVWLGKGQALAPPASVAAPATTPAPHPEAPPPVPAAPAAAPALPASPLPVSATPPLPCEVTDNEITLTLGEGEHTRRWRVRGLSKNLAVDLLKINLMLAVGDAASLRFHVDTLDLYAAKARTAYIAQAARETGLDEHLLKTDLGRLLLTMENRQDDTIRAALAPEPAPAMTEPERAAALAWLQAPDLPARLLADFAACGLIGEETNKLIGYLAVISRKLDRPLGIVIQSSSAAGKTTLLDAVLDFVPDEDKIKYSAMTGQSLYYMGQTNLKHKALAIVEEEGASRAGYALKLLQSEGELTIASTGKDPASGNLITQQYRVEGPVALLLTTTARDLDEELMNRCLVLAVDEGREQTRAIHQRQRQARTLEGLLARQDKAACLTLHHNAQRLLRPLAILNPYAQYLTFPDQSTRLRRDHEKYLTLIDAITLLHQHQREIKTIERGGRGLEYIEVTLADIELANRLAHDVLGRSLDELPPQTRRLLLLIDAHVRAESTRRGCTRAHYRFTRRVLREALHWGDTQLKVHLARLVELEYLIAHRGKTGGFDYELIHEAGDEAGTVCFAGLADLEALRRAYDRARSGQETTRSGPGRRAVGTQSALGRALDSPERPGPARICADAPSADGKTRSSWPDEPARPYPPCAATPALAGG